MEKYGYKNISGMDEFAQSAAENGKHEFSYKSGKYITNNGFINWGEQNKWGSPGQSKYDVKDVNSLLNAADNVSKTS